MKTRNISLILLTLLFCSCTADVLTDGAAGGRVPISVTASESPAGLTRAASNIQVSQFDQGETFRVYFPDGKATVQNALFTTSNARGATVLSEGSEQPYFADNATEATLHAYYPFAVTHETTSFTVQADQSSSDSYKQSDLMYATASVLRDGTSVTADLRFTHQLPKVTVLAVAGGKVSAIRSIRLVSGYRTVNLSSPLTALPGTSLSDVVTEEDPLTLYSDAEGSTTISCSAVLPPQTIDGNFIQVLTDGDTYTYTVTQTLRGGCSYTVPLHVGVNDVSDLNSDNLFIADIADQTYKGEPIRPEVKVYNSNGDLLIAGTDYEMTYSNNIQVGIATVIVMGKGDAYGGALATATFYIHKADAEISYAETAVERTYDDALTLINPLTNTGDGSVTYTSSDTDVATVDVQTGQVTVVSPGTTTITAHVVDGRNYTYPEKTATYTLTVSKRAAQLSFASYSVVKTWGDDPFVNTLTNTGDAGVTFASSNEAVATVDVQTGRVTIVKPGTATITAKAGLSDTYSYATDEVSYTLTVSKATPGLTLSATSGTVQLNRTLTFSITANRSDATLGVSSSDDGVATAVISDGTVTVTGVAPGTASITVSCPETDYYLSSSPVFNVTVTKTPVTGGASTGGWGTGGSIDGQNFNF